MVSLALEAREAPSPFWAAMDGWGRVVRDVVKSVRERRAAKAFVK